MRHGNSNRRFGKTPSHRRAMFRNMATSLLRLESCYTTVEKAKDLKRIVEPLITGAKTDTLHSRRQAYNYLMDKKVVQKLFSEISPRFKNRSGGYLRIIRADRRHGDAAEMCIVELVEKAAPGEAKPKVPKEKKERAPKAKKEAAPKAEKAEKKAAAPKKAKEEKKAR